MVMMMMVMMMMLMALDTCSGHHCQLQKMRRMHYESAVVENTNPGVSGEEGTLPTGHSFPN